MTHGFGKPAFVAVLEAILATLEEMLRGHVYEQAINVEQLANNSSTIQQKVYYFCRAVQILSKLASISSVKKFTSGITIPETERRKFDSTARTNPFA